MKTVKARLKLNDAAMLHLNSCKSSDVELSNIINKHFGEGYKHNPLYITKIILLERAYAYHKRTIDVSYTKGEFITYFMENKKFNKLYKIFVKYNYEKKDRPSFIKAKKLKDVKVTTYEKIMKPSNSQPIDYKYLGRTTRFDSINDAVKDLGISRQTIIRKLKLEDKDPYEKFTYA